MKDITYAKKLEMKKQIDDENGINFSRNIDLSGFTIYKGDNFISFKMIEIDGVQTVVIKYIYVTNKKNLVKLLAFCINMWSGNAVKFIYLLEHRRIQNYTKKCVDLFNEIIISDSHVCVSCLQCCFVAIAQLLHSASAEVEPLNSAGVVDGSVDE